eukprot:TRINITY_DN1461_c0_g2_i1.p1 TRINITY_DN1461_c0_g2~~TRINITY_DN1461_c0_g2_i1.p1  ORF type:complete len:546 (-),score=165.92 TRINITY_DN1461_c0_g2_i1:111-1748(-)
MSATENESLNSYSVANALKSKRIGKIFEHFVIVGIHPQTSYSQFGSVESRKEVVPNIIAEYPRGKKIPFEYLPHFCFPSGINVEAVEKTKSGSNYNEILFGQFSRVESSNNSYVFVMTGQENLYYGICVTESCPIQSRVMLPCEKREEEEKEEKEENDNRIPCDYFAPRCYCFLSRFPFFTVHFEVIYSILALERLRKVEDSCGLSEEDEYGSIHELLDSYYAKEPSMESERLEFQLPNLRAINFACSPGDEDKKLAEWGIASLFQTLSLNSIYAIYRSLLLEKQVLLISKDLGLLSRIGMSLIPLLKPFVLQGPFIPILPTVLHECLEAPVPYLYGIAKLPETDVLERLMKEVCIVWLESNKVHLPFKLATPPKEDLLLKPLKEIHKSIQLEKTTKPMRREAPGRFSLEITNIFRSYQNWLQDEFIFSNLPPSSPTSILDVIHSNEKFDEMIAKLPSSTKDFMSDFMRTQSFSMHSEKMQKILDKRISDGSFTPRKTKNLDIFGLREFAARASAALSPSSSPKLGGVSYPENYGKQEVSLSEIE